MAHWRLTGKPKHLDMSLSFQVYLSSFVLCVCVHTCACASVCMCVCDLMRTHVRTRVPAGGLRDWKTELGSLGMALEEEISCLLWVLGP